MSRIVSIATAVPEHKYAQKKILQFMQGKMEADQEKEKRLLSYVFKKSAIESRYSVLPDFDVGEDHSKLFHLDDTEIPSVDLRMKLYSQEALPLLLTAVKRCLHDINKNDITHVITVSCTGLVAPGLDVLLIEELGLSGSTQRSSINFMGCHGGFHAMRQAYHICGHDPKARVLIADVELSTLHFQKNTTSDEMLANTLFADGAAAVLVCGEESGYDTQINISNFYSRLTLAGKSAMSWRVSADGFVMSLSSQVPNLISEEFQELLDSIFSSEFSGLTKEDVLWAFHPGGVKILDAIKEIGGITKQQMRSSYEVLRQFGNMSSCTIFFVLEELMHEIKSSKKPVFAAGFGPGLSTEVMILNHSK